MLPSVGSNYEVKMQKKYLIIFLLLLLPVVSAVTITDTTFFANQTNFTIFVDSITLDQVIVTNTTIQFHNLTSLGSNLTNTNATFDARADFIGLETGFSILNVNTSVILFSSISAFQDFNATFISGQTIRIISTPSDASVACTTMIAQFGLFPALVGLVGTIILLVGIIFALVTGFVSLKSSGINGRFLFLGLLTVVSIGVLIIVAIVILGALCLTFI